MVLVFSDKFDRTTSKVVEWLYSISKPFKIISISDDSIDIDCYTDKGIVLIVNGAKINLSEITGVYFRRSGIIVKDQRKLKSPSALSDSYSEEYLKYLYGNIISKSEIINSLFHKIRRFGDNNVGRINKILTLLKAKEAGLLTPITLLTTNKKELLDFYETHQQIIIKSLDIGFSESDRETGAWKIAYTKVLNKDNIVLLPEKFGLSLFQKQINKCFEVRSFYFDRNITSVAIFSQNNQRTTIDYRNYDFENPNRQVPFDLPNEIKQKLIYLFELIGINTGSVDFIMDGKDYYFLEINPVGQYENVSYFTNTYIEKQIAEYLVYG